MNEELIKALQEKDHWQTIAANRTAWCYVLGLGFVFAAGVIIASLTGR